MDRSSSEPIVDMNVQYREPVQEVAVPFLRMKNVRPLKRPLSYHTPDLATFHSWLDPPIVRGKDAVP